MSVRVNFTIGHKASIRTKATPDGYTHDWEVYVKGTSEMHDITHFVDKVVFHLHETFPKPKRVVKDPPFSLKESGYAGFVIPIEIYLKNKDEPKKIKFQYDLVLQQSGPDTYNHMNEQYVFHNPNEDFKKKLLKGGGAYTSHSSYSSHEERSRDSFTDERPQLMSKPKLSGEIKKHKLKEHIKPSNSFVNLFGSPIQKPSKVSPDPKKVVLPTLPPPPAPKSEKKEKSSSDKDKQKSKHEHKDKERKKEEKDKAKEEKVRSHNKDAEKSKEKSSKRPNERPNSPATTIPKKKCPSPLRRPPSPPAKINGPREELKPKISETDKKSKESSEIKIEKEKKPKKDKKSHDKEKDRKKEKEHKKDSHKVNKDLPPPSKDFIKPKEEIKKEREMPNDPIPSPVKEKPPKVERPFNKFSIENMLKKPDPPKSAEDTKIKDKGDSERKHKHKKKDKKREESREKHKEKKHKHDRPPKEVPPEPKEPLPPEPEPQPEEPIKEEPVSPISLSSQSSFKSDKRHKMHGLDDLTGTSDSDSDSGPDDDDDQKFKSKQPNKPPDVAMLIKEEIKQEPPTEPSEEKAGPSKEKLKKHKDKKRDDDKKQRKRKSSTKDDEPETKVPKEIKRDSGGPSGSRSIKSETKLQDNGVSSSLGEEGEASGADTESETRVERRDATPEAGELSPDYMLRLKDLQQRIMTIKSNEELERVVNLIAETGRYEVTTQTFDFDLCLLDRSTVQQLIAMIN